MGQVSYLPGPGRRASAGGSLSSCSANLSPATCSLILWGTQVSLSNEAGHLPADSTEGHCQGPSRIGCRVPQSSL